MLVSQWTTEIIVVSAVLAFASLVMGYLIATFRQNRQVSTLAAQLHQAQQNQASTDVQRTLLQNQLKAAEGQCLELQIDQGKMRAQLEAAADTAARSQVELNTSHDQRLALQVKLDAANQQHHDVAKRLEVVQTEGRGLQAQASELRTRLTAVSTAQAELQAERDRWKDECAERDTRAQVAETAEREAREQLIGMTHKLDEQTQALAALQSRYEPLSNQHAELKTSLINSEKQVDELRERLMHAQALGEQLNADRDRLKGELANEGKQVKSLETSEHEAREQLAEAKRVQEGQVQALAALQGRYEPLSNHNAELKASLDKCEKQVGELRERLTHAQALVDQLNADRDRLKDEFASEGRRAQSLETSEREVREQLQDVKTQQASAIERYETLQARFTTQSSEYTKLKTELYERDASHARELANFEKQKASLGEQFKALSNEILEAKTQALQESSKLSLSAAMTPFQQSIDTFKREVQEIHHRETTQQGELRKELEQLKALNQQITAEAHALSTALHGQKKLQGNWGELVLENVLDRSGLQLGKDYQREVSITTEEGRQRPDAVVYLPQRKHLIIDAKVSLNAYTRFVNSEDERERAVALKEHVQAVASRIKELADRDYYKLPGLNSPDMVFMFIPIESAFVEALKADETLFQQAIENNVLVATPTTLLTSLNIVRQLWRYEDQNKHTAALANRAEAVFKKLNNFLGSFEKIKKGLETASEAYVKAEGQLVSGKGNLVKQVGEFKNLAPAIKAQLPAYFADKAALEIDFIPTEQSLTALIESAVGDQLLGENDTETEYEIA